ncbi:hypothetical protein AB1A81_02755 [Bdellovibrio bacteriovorus]|nr:hypothetical protein [Bdellovibrio bacteriovorus]
MEFSARLITTTFLSLAIFGCGFKKDVPGLVEKNVRETSLLNQRLGSEDALKRAVADGDLVDIRRIIEQNPSIQLNQEISEETVLSVALRRGDFEVVALLMSYGASPFVVLKRGEKSAYDGIDRYPARIKSIISYQAQLALNHFVTLAESGNLEYALEFYTSKFIPCALGFERLRSASGKNAAAVSNASVALLSHSSCKKLDSLQFERMLGKELLRVLRAYDRDLSVLYALGKQIPYGVSTIEIAKDNVMAKINPVFLINFRSVCDASFTKRPEVAEWREKIISAFDNLSGLAYEIEVTKKDSIGISSGRALISDFVGMDDSDERRDTIATLTEIPDFFICQGAE